MENTCQYVSRGKPRHSPAHLIDLLKRELFRFAHEAKCQEEGQHICGGVKAECCWTTSSEKLERAARETRDTWIDRPDLQPETENEIDKIVQRDTGSLSTSLMPDKRAHGKA